MEGNFSNRVRDVISYSREEAIRLGHDYIGTEHLLLGIIREGEGIAVKILRNLGCDLFKLKKAIEDTVRSTGGTLTVGNIPLRIQTTFAVLILAQAAHSAEEFVGRLWESFPPARFFTSLVSDEPAVGFVIINVSLIAFGIWCLLWPIRREWPSATSWAWVWVGLELVNGVGHPVWTLSQGAYTPGVITAVLLLVLALSLALQLLGKTGRRPSVA